MPLYEFECEDCGHRFEVIQKSFSDPPPDVCPNCGKRKIRKLLSSPAIQFKGSGWYVTDYGRKGADAGESQAKADAKDAGSSKDAASKDTPSKDSGSKSSEAAPAAPATPTSSASDTGTTSKK